jgi:uncharacterized surface protein with fasciclin (FAS1) repeats
MKKIILTAYAALSLGLLSNSLFAQAATAAKGDIIATLSGNPDYNASAVIIRAAGLGATVKGAGPFTILAPSNIALSNMSSGKLDSLMADPVKLAAVFKGHVLAGIFDKAALIKILGSGTPTLTTIDGKQLTLSVTDKHLTFTDSQGDKAKVVAFDMLGTNGVAIGIDAVLTK